MTETFLPRVNFEVMQRFQGRRVVLLGEVKGTVDGLYILRSSDESEIRVQPSSAFAASWGETSYVEVIGRVLDARTLQEETHVNLKGPPVDLRLYNEMVKLVNGKYLQLFTA